MSEHVVPRTKVARIYNLMARILMAEGWVKNESVKYDTDGRTVLGYCIGGAMTKAVSALNANAYATEANNVLNELAPYRDYVCFNDKSTTTLGDVLVLLHQAQEQVLTNGFEIPDRSDEL